jgi:radical SAM protein with 4Fe4S-binding SPASM domain
MGLMQSPFNLPLDSGDGAAVVNSWTRAVVRGSQASRLRQGKIRGLAPSDTEALAAQRFLVADPEAERSSHEHWFLHRKFHPPLVTINVATHDGSAARARLDAAGRAGVARLLAQALTEASPPAATLRLVGGEPFEDSAGALDLMARARAAAAERGSTLCAAITTSGVLGRSRGARSLVQAVDTFELSLGGARPPRRPGRLAARAGDPDAVTLRAIAQLAELGKTIVVTLRRGARPWPRRTAARVLGDVYGALGNTTYEKLRLRLGPPRAGACLRSGPGGWPEPSAPVSASGRALLRRILEDSPFADQAGSAGPEPVLPPPLEQSGDLDLCSYLRGCAFYVAASGDLFLCPALPLAVGRVTSEAHLDLRRLRVTNADPFDDGECRACTFVPLCAGRCPVGGRGVPCWRADGCRERARTVLASWVARKEPAASDEAAPRPVFAVVGPA